jgi:hypothetical protein
MCHDTYYRLLIFVCAFVLTASAYLRSLIFVMSISKCCWENTTNHQVACATYFSCSRIACMCASACVLAVLTCVRSLIFGRILSKLQVTTSCMRYVLVMFTHRSCAYKRALADRAHMSFSLIFGRIYTPIWWEHTTGHISNSCEYSICVTYPPIILAVSRSSLLATGGDSVPQTTVHHSVPRTQIQGHALTVVRETILNTPQQ